MKNLIISISLVAAFIKAEAIEIKDLKWTQDYEMLVNLNSSIKGSIEGLDQNKNGIRDDIEYYVLNKYEDKPFEREMFLDAAKKIQKILTLPKDDIQTRIKLDKELIDIYTCRDYMLYKLQSPTIQKDIQDKLIFKSKVLNTKKRLEAYKAHKKLLPFRYEELDDKKLNSERIACQNRYNAIMHQDVVSSK